MAEKNNKKNREIKKIWKEYVKVCLDPELLN